MTVHKHDFDEVILVEMSIHDLVTGNNLIMVIRGTEDELAYQLRITAGVMVQAGFGPGWLEQGTYRGLVDHLIVAREAVDRCWKEQKAKFEADN